MGEKAVRHSVPLSFAKQGLEKLYPNSQITELTPILTGFANSIFSFRKDGAAFILRMPPAATLSLVREAELTRALFRQGIPVPQVLEYDATYQNPLGHPFMIMERLEGVNLLEAAERLNEAEMKKLLREIAAVLRRVHRIDAKDLKVREFPTLQSLLDWGISYLKQFAALSPLKNFEELERWMQENRPGEATYNKAFIHNDFHALNILVKGDRLSGIIDWNDAIVGEAQADVALFSLLIEAAGYPELAEAFIAAYRQVSGLLLGEIDFYVAILSIQKFIQIPLQERQLKETGQTEKARLMGSLRSRLEKGLTKIIEENTSLTLDLK